MAVINPFEVGSQLGAQADKRINVNINTSGAMAAVRENMQMANTLQQGADRLYEQIVNADVMKANNEYNMRMNEVRNRLFQNKEDKAFGNVAEYEKERNKIIGDILKNGPRSVRFGSGNTAFMTMAEKDWTNQKDVMQRYQIAEAEKYQDTTMKLQLNTTLDDISAGYITDDDLQRSMRRDSAIIYERYKNYGTGRIALETEKAQNSLIQTAVATALAKDDYIRASEIMQGYGSVLSPDKRIAIDKAISERIKSDNELTEMDKLYEQTGGNIEEALKQFDANTYDASKGINYAKSMEGEYLGENQCAIFVSDTIKQSGGDTDLISTLADGMYRNAEEKGMTFTDRKELRDGDVVYWQVKGSGYTASNDPEAVESDSYAYKGITHVGVYDASTGKVIQSGSHGVGAIDIDTYNVVGFSHVGAKPLSAVEKQNNQNKLIKHFEAKDSIKRKIDDARFNEWSKQVKYWHDNNVPITEAYKRAEAFAGDDIKKLESARNAVKQGYWEFDGGRASGSGKGFAYGVKGALSEMLRAREFQNKEEFIDFVLANNPTKAEFDNAMKTYNDWDKGEGEFKYNFNEIKEEVMSGSKLKDAEYNAAWAEARAAGVEFIKEYERDKGYTPSVYEVISAAKKGMIKEYYGKYSSGYADDFLNDLEISRGQLLRAGIKSIKAVPGSSDIYEVTFIDGRPVQAMSGYSINMFLGKEE